MKKNKVLAVLLVAAVLSGCGESPFASIDGVNTTENADGSITYDFTDALNKQLEETKPTPEPVIDVDISAETKNYAKSITGAKFEVVDLDSDSPDAKIEQGSLTQEITNCVLASDYSPTIPKDVNLYAGGKLYRYTTDAYTDIIAITPWGNPDLAWNDSSIDEHGMFVDIYRVSADTTPKLATDIETATGTVKFHYTDGEEIHYLYKTADRKVEVAVRVLNTDNIVFAT